MPDNVALKHFPRDVLTPAVEREVVADLNTPTTLTNGGRAGASGQVSKGLTRRKSPIWAFRRIPSVRICVMRTG